MNNNKIVGIDADLELEIMVSRKGVRLLLLHEFCLGCKVTEATSKMCGTMSKYVLSIRTARHCFYRFKNRNFELDSLPHTGRSLQVDMGLLKQLIEEDSRMTTRCLAE